ncbi:MAG: hypothetical protein OSA99_16685 [Acidimicrobiales bacterium]|nr:hypothetical protein [Acidimicrobiales bacterium]
MYDFALVALMALALVKTVDFVVDQMSGLERMRSLLTFAGGIATMWLLDYSLFTQWDVAIRDETLGIWVTGFMVAGMTVVWRAMFSYLTHNTSPIDETLGDHHPLLERVS